MLLILNSNAACIAVICTSHIVSKSCLGSNSRVCPESCAFCRGMRVVKHLMLHSQSSIGETALHSNFVFTSAEQCQSIKLLSCLLKPCGSQLCCTTKELASVLAAAYLIQVQSRHLCQKQDERLTGKSCGGLLGYQNCFSSWPAWTLWMSEHSNWSWL